MTYEQDERLVVAFEQIAQALQGLHDTGQKEFAKRFPERKEPREAVVTRIPTAEDLIREDQGASDEPIEEWIGLREQEFLSRPQTADQSQPDGGSDSAAESKA